MVFEKMFKSFLHGKKLGNLHVKSLLPLKNSPQAKVPSTSIWQGVCHIVALPFTIKKYLKAKEEFF
jgi:hypothetical protein